MRIGPIALLALWCPLAAWGQAAVVEGSLSGFGAVEFGTRRASVEHALRQQITDRGIDHIIYEAVVGGVAVSVTQYFERGGAHRATVELARSEFPDRCAREFERAKKMTGERYGKPAFESESPGKVEVAYEFETGGRIDVVLQKPESQRSCRVRLFYQPAPRGEAVASF